MNRQRLIIRISRDGIAFSTTEEGAVRYERYPINSGISLAANMREALRTQLLLQDDYERVVVLIDSPVLCVPVAEFREEERDQLYYYSFTRQDHQTVAHAILPDLNSVAVFSVAKDLRQVLADRFGRVSYQPLMSTVWRRMYQKSFTGPHAKLYCYFHDRKVEVFSFEHNRFKFQNVYAATTVDDALYYVLSVWKQLGMDPQNDELHLAGQSDDMKERALQFVKRVFVSSPTGEFNRAPVTQIEGMPYDTMLVYLRS
jgi:hypothetical protein